MEIDSRHDAKQVQTEKQKVLKDLGPKRISEAVPEI
jgi:hypothetical protein